MNLDLSDLEDWTDDDIMEALNDIEDGLSDNDLAWIGRFQAWLDNGNTLSSRQRETAEAILRRVNKEGDRHG